MIGVISDIHDNLHNLVLFLREAEKLRIKEIFCLGDYINPGVVQLLASQNIPVYGILGNNDGDLGKIFAFAHSPRSSLTLILQSWAEIEKEGRKIFLTHYPDIAEIAIQSQKFDAVFYGHNHLKELKTVNKCVVLNPGEISAHKTKTASFAIYDPQKNKGELMVLKNSMTVRSRSVEEFLQKLK